MMRPRSPLPCKPDRGEPIGRVQKTQRLRIKLFYAPLGCNASGSEIGCARMMNRFRPREFGEIRIDMVDREITESEMETWLTEMLAVHHRTILKAPVIGTMVL